MKKVVIGAMAVLALTACSNEEVIQTNEQNNEITFTAVTDKATSRAADGFSNGNMPGDFQVWAKVGTKNYFSGQQYKRDGETSTYKIPASDPVRYWPESGTIDFFAAKNYEGANSSSVTWNAADAKPAKITDFVVPTDVTQQHDFIYAVKTGASKEANTLNFRHGLAEVVFRAKNENNNISIIVHGVKVMNVKNKGTFTFPTTSTDGNIIDADNPQNTTFTGEQGSWAVSSEASDIDSYSVTLSNIPVTVANSTTEPVSLTYNFIDANKRYNNGSLYLMEQNATTAWDGSAAVKNSGNYLTTCGAFLVLNCTIYNVAAGNGNVHTGDDIVLWSAKDIAVKFPENVTWKHGYKYVYTFTFTKAGNGGTDPDTNQPVFTPITLSVTVDDFANESETGVNMTRP